MLIRSYFTVEKCDRASWYRLIVPTSMMESVKADMQHTAGVKCTTDGEGGSTEKKGALAKRSPPKIRRRSGSSYAAEH